MKKIHYLALFIILTLGMVFRLYKINSPIADWHSWRQADTASVSKIYAEDGIDLLRPKYHDLSNIPSGLDNPNGWRFVEFPIYNALHAVLYKTHPEWGIDKWGRLTSALLSIISALFIFLIGRKVAGATVGLAAAFFFVALPFNIYFSRVILPEPMAVTFVCGALWFFLRYTDKENLLDILLAGIFLSFAVLVKPYTIFYGLVVLYLAYEKFRIKKGIVNVNLWVFLALVAAPFLFWRGWMWEQDFLRGIPHWKWALNGDHIRFRPAFWWWMFEERVSRMILGGWAIFPFLVGLLDKQKGPYPWFFQVLVASQLVYISTIATASVRHDYYQTLIIPAVALALGAGTVKLWNTTEFNRSLTRLALCGCVAFGLFFSFYQIKEFYKINHPEIILAGEATDKLLPKRATVIAPYDGDTAFLYQTKRAGWPYVTLPMNEMVNDLGAQYYVSVNFDNQTNQVMTEYTVIEKTPKYVIVDLQRKNAPPPSTK